ncbi:hypothetical protein IU436_28705 [Nocardia farcinica]|uniref:hypothetical protein n=1 Tax=Nocardia farcinica TaxID=37329 RepID=UPI00189556E1|nr:hypothetical protein [Nocardia farcinica]MBF6422544.1 hypothetical protein [Nocardia farcinica]MBF6434315.1 hypothetical protein [Nocardia farcinica]MBF6505399.1 hypothetical protein [Nocardia farcinica]
MFRKTRTVTAADPLLTADLPDRVAEAHKRLAHQDDPALLAALSESELQASREVAELARDADRQETVARLRSAQAIRADIRRAQEELVRAEAGDLIAARTAIAQRQRESSPDFEIARLHKQKKWSTWALTGVVLACMLWSAANVQHNLAPGGPNDPLYWFSYLLEATISVVLVVFMVNGAAAARWKITEDDDRIFWIEMALLAASIGLNVYPHLADGDLVNTATHGVAPVMVGVALFAHPLVQGRFGRAIDRAKEAAEAEGIDIAARLAALTSTAHYVTSTRTDHLAPATEPALTARTSDPADEEVRPRTSDQVQGTSADSTGSADAARTYPEPALLADPHLASAESAGPAPAESADTTEEQPAPETQLDTPAEVPTASTDVTEQASDATTAATEEAPEPAEPAAVEMPEPPAGATGNVDLVRAPRTSRSAPRTPQAREVRTPHQPTRTTASPRTPRPVSADPAPALTAPVMSALAVDSSASADSEPQVRASLTALADQVRARGTGRRLPLETVTRVLEMASAGATANAIHADTGVHHKTVKAIRDTAELIRAEAGQTGGRVIQLRKS